MDKYTKALSELVSDKGIKLSRLSEKTGIPYHTLYDCLSQTNGRRSLRLDEFIEIVNSLEFTPDQLYKFFTNQATKNS